MTMMEMTVKIIPVKFMDYLVTLDILEFPRYIPVHGQKQYCDMIRKLSGADNKDEQVEFPPPLPPIPHPQKIIIIIIIMIIMWTSQLTWQ